MPCRTVLALLCYFSHPDVFVCSLFFYNLVALDQNDAEYKKKVTACRTAEEAKFVKNGGDAKAYKKDMQDKAKIQLLDKMTLGDSDDATLEAELEALGVDKKKLKRMKKEALTDSTSDTFSGTPNEI